MEMNWSNIDTELDSSCITLSVRWITEALRFDGFNHDCLSKCQIVSKVRLIQLLKLVGGIHNVAIAGSWYGQLANMMCRAGMGDAYTGIDIDPEVADIATHLNRYSNYTHVTDDMYMHDFSPYDTVINTSCEHIADLKDWLDGIPSGTLVALQSNNYLEGEGHINCSHSLTEFTEKAGLERTIIGDTLSMPLYTRYTIIGRV